MVEQKQCVVEKKKPPLAPPRSPFIKERKIRRQIRDDYIKGILESVIARVSDETSEQAPACLETDFNQNHPEEWSQSRDVYSVVRKHDQQYKQNDQTEDQQATTLIIEKPTEAKDKLFNNNNNQHESMDANNARREELWNKVMNESNLSLNKMMNNNK